MPPIVKMAADVMFPELKPNERVKALFKLMEDGKLDPNTLLPKLAALMRDMSEPMMEKYWGTLAYRMGTLKKTSENVFREFMGAGGDRGLAYIVRGLEQLIGSTTVNIKTWGMLFEDVGRRVGDVFLILRDLTEYVGGIKHEDNVFQKMFGDPDDNKLLTSIKNAVSEFKELNKELITFMSTMENNFLAEKFIRVPII